MADTKSYENTYRRYLEDDADTYLKEGAPEKDKLIAGGIATVGLAGGGYLGYKAGLFRPLIEGAIKQMGKYRKGRAAHLNEGLRRFSEEEGLGKLGDVFLDTMKGNFSNAKNNLDEFTGAMKKVNEYKDDALHAHERRVKEMSSRELRDTEFDLHRQYSNMQASIKKLKEEKYEGDILDEVLKVSEQAMIKEGKISKKEQDLKMKQTGHRFATVGDLIAKKEINEMEEFIEQGRRMMTRHGGKEEDFNDFIVDRNILIDKDGNLSDLRDARDMFSGFVNSLATDFTIPLIKINPLRMFYLDHFFSKNLKPFIYTTGSNQRNPIVTGHNGSAQSPHLYVNGSVFEFIKGTDGKDQLQKMDGNYFLADAKKGPVARLIRNMSGITISKFNTPEANDPLWQRAKYNLGSWLDIGFQDEPPAQFDFFDPMSWGQSAINKGTSFLRQNKYQQRDDYLSEAFGADAEFIFMRSYKPVQESGSYKDYLNQFGAGRKNLEDVTVASLFPYGFFERLNATLNQVNLGLSNDSLGSAFDVFSGLVMKRIAPLWAGMEMWDYVNYESENFMGEQLSDRMAKMYVASSVELADWRDRVGITDWAKDVAPLFVGGEQLADIPILGNTVDLNQTAEETVQYWEEGEDAVRKGRWWPLGNTPYTGAKIDYFQPNWYRRVLSDYEFSDSLYGSREEYFENTWMPTPRNPLAPVRHFITDPYHYEQKHYLDRPYPVTGGISEFENFPLVGPLINNTLGQLLKPTRTMHQEYFSGSMTEVTSDTEQMTTSFLPSEMMSGTGGASFNFTFPQGIASPPVEMDQEYQEMAQPMVTTYVTPSGNIQILTAEDEDAMWDARSALGESSPMRTGRFKRESYRPPQAALEESEQIMSPMAWQQTAANLHYNMGEMGGFYGFMGVSMTGEMQKGVPVLQSSHEMTSYSRAFWDMDIGGFGGDANEIFRRFLPKDRRTEDVNPIPNTMPDWLPGSNYFTNFQTGDPYVKVKKGEMRLPGEGYERLYDIDSDKLMKLDIGASNIGRDEATIREHMLQEDAYMDEALSRLLEKGTKWHESWEIDMAQQGIAVKKDEADDNFSIIGGESDWHDKYYMEGYVKDEEAGIGGFYDVLAHHDKAIDWLYDNAVEFTYYNPTYNKDPLGTNTPNENLGGFYYEGEKVDLSSEESKQAYKEWAVSVSDKALIDPKTRSARRWEEDEMHFENAQQVNMYAQQMKTPINYLIHVDRDNPEKGIKVFAFGANPHMYEYSKNKVEGVRQGIKQDIETGDLHRGNLYDPLDRFRILADVAPYSEEFRVMKSQIRNMGLKEHELDEVREIESQVQQRRERLRLYPYRFKTANLEEQVVTVDRFIDSNTFIAKEHPDNPIRLAGVHVSTAADNPVAQEAERIVRQAVKEGSKVKIAYDADENNRIKDDTYRTLQSVVYDRKGRNLNKYLLENELATEKETDWTPASVHARFTPNEIRFGANWEEFAHMDTILHTKFLQVRSPLESYERREVYGKDWQEWQDPIGDFLIPAIQNATQHHPLLAIAGGGFIGASFGSLKPSDVGGEKIMARYGKILGGTIGAGVMAGAVLSTMIKDASNGYDKAWIPERREKERDTEEYFDVLKYVKYNKLFEQYADMALREEGFDVKAYVKNKEISGAERQKRIDQLEDIKRRLYTAKQIDIPKILKELREIFGIDAPDRKSAMKELNKELTSLQNYRELNPTSPVVAKALLYKQASKQTLYGYEAGDPLANILAALPKKDRDYLVPFINAPEEERDRILQVVPDYMKRPLQSAWGMDVDAKESLRDFFYDNPLPSANWEGWRESVSLDDVKVKYVDRVGLDPSEFDIWPDDEARANQLDIGVPDIEKGRETAYTFATKIRDLLGSYNMHETDIEVVRNNTGKHNVNIDYEHDRRREIKDLVNREGGNLI